MYNILSYLFFIIGYILTFQNAIPPSREKPEKLHPPVAIRYGIPNLLKPPRWGLKFSNPPVSITENLTVFGR